MIGEEEALLKLKSALKECDSHLERIAKTRELLRPKFPLTVESFLSFLNALFEQWPRMEGLYLKVRKAALERLGLVGI